MDTTLRLIIAWSLYIWPLTKAPWAPKTMKNKGFGHLKTRLFTIKTSKHVGFGDPRQQTLPFLGWLLHLLCHVDHISPQTHTEKRDIPTNTHTHTHLSHNFPKLFHIFPSCKTPLPCVYTCIHISYYNSDNTLGELTTISLHVCHYRASITFSFSAISSSSRSSGTTWSWVSHASRISPKNSDHKNTSHRKPELKTSECKLSEIMNDHPLYLSSRFVCSSLVN